MKCQFILNFINLRWHVEVRHRWCCFPLGYNGMYL